jgi:phage repressor protein C with HTH and peptisase S24 domain
MKFLERIKMIRKKKGLTQQDIAEYVGVSKTAVSRWELGHSIPSGERLKLLADKLECGSEYLLSGEGSVSTNPLSEVVFLDFYYEICAAAGNGCINEMEESVSIPVPKSVVMRQKNTQDLSCIKITGSSMEPVLCDGAIIAFNPHTKNIIDGSMYVILQDGFLRVKILIEEPKRIIIRSYNPQFKDEILLKNSNEDFHIVGKVFWHVSSL